MKRILYTLLFVFGLLASAWADGSRYASESVLNSGKWVKIQVAEDGIYKLTAADLKKMGFSNLDKVAVCGYGGWPLDEDFSTAYIDDVPEVAVWRNADYLLFYGKGPRKWEYSSSDKSFIHTNNPYSNYGYYFVTEKETAGRTMEKAASADGATLQVTTFDDYVLHEEELVSVNSSGRELYGESFTSTLSRDFTISVPGITNDEGKATLSFISRGNGTITMNVDGNSLISGSVSVPSDEYEVARELYRERAWTADKGETVKVNIGYSTTGHKNVYLNYFRLQMKRQLKVYDDYTFFRSLSAVGNASRFVVQGADANTLVFDVTDGINPLQMETSLNGTELSFSIPASASLREFVAVKPSQIKAPVTVGEVANQDLHALAQQDMIIIAQPNFTTQAERLAEAHRTKDNLTVRVVTPEAIYNEFSSGTPDATAYRRFMKMFYDRQTSEADAPKYLLLFGDGSYDNRKLTSSWKSVDMNNMLLTYQTEESLNQHSYVVDDYFGFLDDADDKVSLLYRKKVCLGIGRFPVRTVEQATQAVDKVISYMENKNTGSWKNNLCFMADDGNNADSFTTDHMSYANQLATYIESEHPEFLVNKLYYDAGKISCQLPGNIQHLSFDRYLFQGFERDRASICRMPVYGCHFHPVFRISHLHSRIADQAETQFINRRQGVFCCLHRFSQRTATPIVSLEQVTDHTIVYRKIRSGVSNTDSRKQRNASAVFTQKYIFSGRSIQVVESCKITRCRNPYRQMGISKLVDICLCQHFLIA
jgi:hypothetical protein